MTAITERLLAYRFFVSGKWIMLLALITITGFMILASKADARTPAPHTLPKGQTISHCGLLENRNVVYAMRNQGDGNYRNTRIIQQKLEQLGYSVGRPGIDGKFGHRTRNAVRKFQHDNLLEVDGVVGIETSRTLAYLSHPIGNVRKCKYMSRANLR